MESAICYPNTPLDFGVRFFTAHIYRLTYLLNFDNSSWTIFRLIGSSVLHAFIYYFPNVLSLWSGVCHQLCYLYILNPPIISPGRMSSFLRRASRYMLNKSGEKSYITFLCTYWSHSVCRRELEKKRKDSLLFCWYI